MTDDELIGVLDRTTNALLDASSGLVAGMSRRTLARRAGVPISTISGVEDGAVDPTITMVQRVAMNP